MRDTFRRYFPPTDKELRALWSDGLISFDASVLLNVYGYSAETRDELVALIEQNASRIRLPHQFALEYCRDRSATIIKQVRNYLKVEKALQEILDNDLKPKRDHPFLSKSSLDAFAAIQAELKSSREQMEKLVGADPHSEKLLAALDGKVGAPPNAEELRILHDDAKRRYDNLTPPGYADLKKKDGPDAFGDCIGWKQLISIAQAEKKGFILVIDDLKDDWWRIEHERTVGPRPELIEEFARESGQILFMYTSENFLRAANKFMAAKVDNDAIEEVAERIASQRAKLQAVHLKADAIVSVLDEYVKATDRKTEKMSADPNARRSSEGDETNEHTKREK